jgi:archaeosine synthase
MLTDKRGMISLTMDGAKRLESIHQYYVEISDDFTLKGSVFAPGIIDSDPAIRKGDETLVFQKGVLKGVGVAQMSGYEMIHRMSGKAVDIRHHI